MIRILLIDGPFGHERFQGIGPTSLQEYSPLEIGHDPSRLLNVLYHIDSFLAGSCRENALPHPRRLLANKQNLIGGIKRLPIRFKAKLA